MMIDIANIKVAKRIRSEASKIDELAADIKANGLLNPISVMPLDNGQYQLLAGLRRLKACAALGMDKVMVNIIPVADAEHALRIEFSENIQREDFTFSEKMDYAIMFEGIERAKAAERKKSTLKQNNSSDRGESPYREAGRVRDIVGHKLGINGREYDRSKYIAANASSETIQLIDEGKVSIRTVYDSLRSKEKAMTNALESSVVSKQINDANSGIQAPRVMSFSKTESAFDTRLRKLKPEKLAINPHYAELKNKYETMRYEANTASSRMRDMEINHKNQVYHLESINSMLDRRVEALEAALIEANARIIDLGGEPV